ncbi:hypothetical protein BT67DRAFT_479183 [Trichocladium antarcticum]|uniref:Protein kinase domain-containing protein n=1 Tax=Trichocladium antarcticum TaxID=1450529 RepID=A0AAN6ZCC9_9PEZI|nr:hypothetical protein BT67DRAFT_479183 [Trichocladium antarcticum]
MAERKHFPFPTLLDSSTHNGPNDTHKCLVTEPGMCSLARSKSTSQGVWYFDLILARIITAQLIRATVRLHSRGIVHGDIHLGNILFTLPSSFYSSSTENLYTTYREPIRETVQRLDGVSQLPVNVPAYVVPPE